MAITHVPVDNREKFNEKDKQEEYKQRLIATIKNDSNLPQYFTKIFLEDAETPQERAHEVKKIDQQLRQNPQWRSATQDSRRHLMHYLIYVIKKLNKQKVQNLLAPHIEDIQMSLMSEKEHKSINRPTTIFGCLILNADQTCVYGQVATDLGNGTNKLIVFSELPDENVNIQDPKNVFYACVRNALRSAPISFSVVTESNFIITSDKVNNIIHFTALAVEDKDTPFSSENFSKNSRLNIESLNKVLTWTPLTEIIDTESYNSFGVHGLLDVHKLLSQLRQEKEKNSIS